jgi:hypothetical protein
MELVRKRSSVNMESTSARGCVDKLDMLFTGNWDGICYATMRKDGR